MRCRWCGRGGIPTVVTATYQVHYLDEHGVHVLGPRYLKCYRCGQNHESPEAREEAA